jgi:hypothetical protein
MRHRRLLGSLLAVAACASPGMPPGGPPDAELPVLVRMLPDSNAVNVRVPAVVLRFNEVVSERSSATAAAGRGPTTPGAAASMGGGSAGAAGLAGLLVLSPSDGRDEVIWRREALELRPRRGFRPNTAYRVTLLPGLADLRGNRVTEPFSFVFSTGGAIPTGVISGVVFDWTTGKPAANALVEVFIAPDSSFRWSARADSLGQFRIGELTPGTYELRTWVDANNDRRVSFREISDTAQVTLADTASRELYAYVRDTVPARLEAVELLDSTAIRFRVDRGIVADWDGRSAELVGADSAVIALGGPFVPSVVYDSLARARAQAARDSAAAAAADSVAASQPPDTGRVETTRPEPRDSADRAAPEAVDADTSAAEGLPRPVFRRSVPVTQWTAPLAAPLAPGTYLFRIREARGLNGRSVEAQREIRVTAPPARP